MALRRGRRTAVMQRLAFLQAVCVGASGWCVLRPPSPSSYPPLLALRALPGRAPRMCDADASTDDDALGRDLPGRDADLDWRSFRARLVAQEAQADASAEGSLAEDGAAGLAGAIQPGSGDIEGWVHQTPLIEQGSVILASTQQRYDFALRQQYFHKSVILVLCHGADFTQGIILNRPTPFKDNDGWPLWFGGDVQGFGHPLEERLTICLHALTSPAVERMSVQVIRGIYYTSLKCAKGLVAMGDAKSDDFWTFSGYSGWGPGQLQGEIDRDTGSSWLLASADGDVLLRELLGQRCSGHDGDGLATWNKLMRGIGHGADEVDSSSGGFSDRMLLEWIRVHLRPVSPTPYLTAAAVDAAAAASKGKRSPVVLEDGAVLRSAAVVSSFTLSRQFLHKAILLVLRVGDRGCMSLVLNRPSTDPHIVFPEFGNQRHILYGGDLSADELLWFHRNPALEGVLVGNSGVYYTSRENAATAIASGEAKESDFLVVEGVTMWPRGSLEREVAAGNFVPLEDMSHAPWEGIWRLVEPVDAYEEPPSIDSTGMHLWESIRAAEPAAVISADSTETADGDVDLADLALLKWMEVFMP